MSETIGLKELIDQRIEALRPKLLDLTKRNPLLSTKFSDRSNTIVRVVDEIPSFLFNKPTFKQQVEQHRIRLEIRS
jgi:hypothetical protein